MREGLPTAPLEPLLRLVAATNLSIAGRRVHVDDVVPGADVLRRALLAIGAIDGGEQADHAVVADYAFVADGAAVVHRIVAPPHRPVVVVECGAGVSALGAPLRPGVVGTDRADVVLVPAPASAAAPPAVPAVPAVPGPAVPGPAAPGDAAARIHWARRFMPVSRRLAAELRDDGLLAGRAVGLSLVLEPKTAVLALLLAEAGAAVSVFAFAAETDDAVAAELRERGIAVHASATATPAEERAHALAFLTGTNSGTNTGAPRALDVLIDDGAHVLRLAHAERPDAVARLLGASEETTSGLTPLRAMAADGALRVPVIAANDARSKTWFDNRHGTGETCAFAILRVLGRSDLTGVRSVVVGFGPVGQSVAQVLDALGADVVVVDTDSVRALAATFAGHDVVPLLEAVADAALVVSATGVPGTIDVAALLACAPGAAVAVAGGAPEEVALTAARAAGARREAAGPHLEVVRFPNGHEIRLLAGGDCVNIIAGEGNPIEIMDLSFGVQLGAIRMLIERRGTLEPGVHPIDPALDARVAALAAGVPAPAATNPAATPAATAPWRRTRFEPGASA